MRKLMMATFGPNAWPLCYGEAYNHCGGEYRCNDCNAPVDRGSQCSRRIPTWSWLAAAVHLLTLDWLMPHPQYLTAEAPQREEI